MTRRTGIIAVIALMLVVGGMAAGCASYGDYDRPAPYGSSGGSGGSCH